MPHTRRQDDNAITESLELRWFFHGALPALLLQRFKDFAASSKFETTRESRSDYYLKNNRETVGVKLRKDGDEKDIELKFLKAQYHPHFLFNALNTIAALSAIDPRAVPGATSRLARFLRGSLEQHDRVTVPLREELEIVAAYLDVELLRMGGRLQVERCVEAGLLEAQIPPFLVQPLVENAVRHGIQPRDEGGRVRLEARAEGSWLHITVADTGVGLAPGRDEWPGRGPGDRAHALDLLRLRLAKLYDASFSLEVRGGPGAGTTAAIRIPLEGCERPAVREEL